MFAHCRGQGLIHCLGAYLILFSLKYLYTRLVKTRRLICLPKGVMVGPKWSSTSTTTTTTQPGNNIWVATMNIGRSVPPTSRRGCWSTCSSFCSSHAGNVSLMTSSTSAPSSPGRATSQVHSTFLILRGPRCAHTESYVN